MTISPGWRFEGKFITPNIPASSRPLLLTLSYHLMELEIHIDRIKDNKEFLTSRSRNMSDPQYHRAYYELLTDTHSYVIAWTNVDKTLLKLVDFFSEKALEEIYKKRKPWFTRIRKARNHLEHLDERAVSNRSLRFTRDISRVMSDQQKNISILGVRVDIRQGIEKRLLDLLEELDLWLDTKAYSDIDKE